MRGLFGWRAGEKRVGRATALAALLVVVVTGCASSGPQGGDGTRAADERSVDIPRSGVFATSAKHFDRVIRSGERPTVVNVWASWCIPCRAETPRFVAAAKRYEGRLRFLGLNTQDDRKAALGFIDEFGIPYASGLDPTGSIARHLKILGLPATLFYDPNGELFLVHNGEISSSDLEAKVEELLTASRSTSEAGRSG